MLYLWDFALVEKILSNGKTVPEFLKDARTRARQNPDGYSTQKEEDEFWEMLVKAPNVGLPEIHVGAQPRAEGVQVVEPLKDERFDRARLPPANVKIMSAKNDGKLHRRYLKSE